MNMHINEYIYMSEYKYMYINIYIYIYIYYTHTYIEVACLSALLSLYFKEEIK